IHSHSLRAGYLQGAIDACQVGAVGAVDLSCKDSNADYLWLVGVSSCARVHRLGVYSSTQHFHAWILVQMGLRPTVRATPA
ncbi:Acrosin, partial [Chlamydotis macqueenii]